MTDPRAGDPNHRRHLVVDGFASTEPFQSPLRGRSPTVPERNRRSHGLRLREGLDAVAAEAARLDAIGEEVSGLTVEFVGFPDVELAFESLALERSGIELLNIRPEGDAIHATVFVPDGKLVLFEKRVADYLEDRRGANGQSLDHRRLIDTIAAIRVGSLRALWTDSSDQFPAEDTIPLWWEVWLPVRGRREEIVGEFHTRALEIGMRLATGQAEFPERTVVLSFATPAQMRRSVSLLNLVAELRRAKETADFFDSLMPTEQRDWIDDLVRRTTFSGRGDSPHVCLLDTGCNRGHPLIAPVLAAADMQSVDPAWGVDDSHSHGTEMAGLAIFGDLTPVLAAGAAVQIEHRLESVKLLPGDNANQGDALHHAYLTTEAVSRPEITAPFRPRVFGMAVSTQDYRDRGRPSAWSSAIDRLASDAEGEGNNPRLLIICAGNSDQASRDHYPDGNTTDGVHDPGQSWNALTIGSSTELTRITEPEAEDYQPVAASGGLSPFSTTSAIWESQWPLKPDVLFEGGNAGRDAHGVYSMASLSVLTTHFRPAERLLTTARETSASTFLAARMAAQVMAAYPDLRPETVRGLIVHSAAWTDEMKRMFLQRGANATSKDYARLVRHCGFGIPNLDRAIWSASNSLSMIVEEQLQPFERSGSAVPKLRDMQLHELPWPKEELESLGNTTVQMRVTLSYFIEPNPSARGRSRYTYQSHALRFKAKRADESIPSFRGRINRAARDEEEGSSTGGDDPRWRLGSSVRHRGSIHSDIWQGPAVDLASCGVLAVYPAMGWWKTRTALEQYDRATPYSLIVSIHTPETEVDIYAAVQTAISVQQQIET